MNVTVESYAGYKGEERPLRFSLSGEFLEVTAIIDRWYGPGYRYFKVTAGDGNRYILKYDEAGDAWDLTFFDRA